MKKLTLALIASALFLGKTSVFGGEAVSVDYGVFYVHDQVQTDSSTVSDYSSGSVPGQEDPGPYWFYAFDDVNPPTATSNLTLPAPDPALTYDAQENQFKFQSTGKFTTLGALVNDYPTGQYQITGSGTGSVGPSNLMALGDSAFPNTPTILNVNGSAAEWLGGKLILNPTQTNTINWTAFSGYSTATYGAHMDFDLYDSTGPGGEIEQQAFTGPNNSGPGAAFDSYQLNPGDLVAGDTYNGTISYDLGTDLETDTNSGGYDFAGDEVRLNFVVQVVPESNNFWLAGLALLAMGLRFVARQRKTASVSIA